MNVCFRVDASFQIGTGHLQRCMALASVLKKKGANIIFISRALPESSIEELKKLNFDFYLLSSDSSIQFNNSKSAHAHWLTTSQEADAEQTINVIRNKKIDWLIVDHYAIDIEWQKKLRKHVKKIFVIDDLADRKHDCDILLDQHLNSSTHLQYDKLTPKYTKYLLGPTYALLREEFAITRKHFSRHINSIRRVLIFFGGSDYANITEKILESIILLNRNDITFDIIFGSLNSRKEMLKNKISNLANIKFYDHVNNIANLMTEADFAIGAGGTTLLERYCLGLPSMILSCADNQEKVSEEAHKAGLIYYVGKALEVNHIQLTQSISICLNDVQTLSNMSQKGMNLVDGLGCERVADNLALNL